MLMKEVDSNVDGLPQPRQEGKGRTDRAPSLHDASGCMCQTYKVNAGFKIPLHVSDISKRSRTKNGT